MRLWKKIVHPPHLRRCRHRSTILQPSRELRIQQQWLRPCQAPLYTQTLKITGNACSPSILFHARHPFHTPTMDVLYWPSLVPNQKGGHPGVGWRGRQPCYFMSAKRKLRRLSATPHILSPGHGIHPPRFPQLQDTAWASIFTDLGQAVVPA